MQLALLALARTPYPTQMQYQALEIFFFTNFLEFRRQSVQILRSPLLQKRV